MEGLDTLKNVKLEILSVKPCSDCGSSNECSDEVKNDCVDLKYYNISFEPITNLNVIPENEFEEDVISGNFRTQSFEQIKHFVKSYLSVVNGLRKREEEFKEAIEFLELISVVSESTDEVSKELVVTTTVDSSDDAVDESPEVVSQDAQIETSVESVREETIIDETSVSTDVSTTEIYDSVSGDSVIGEDAVHIGTEHVVSDNSSVPVEVETIYTTQESAPVTVTETESSSTVEVSDTVELVDVVSDDPTGLHDDSKTHGVI